MKLIFIDEIAGNKEINKNLFGISLMCLDSSKYTLLCKDFFDSLESNGWPADEELKGKYLFSRNPAGQTKTPEEMISLTKEIIEWLSGNSRSRADVRFFYNFSGNSLENYLLLLETALDKLDKPSSCKNGKNLACAYIDNFDSLIIDKVSEVVAKALAKRNYKLVEGIVTPINSCNNAVGIIYSDVLAYICRWIVENPSRQDLNLFEIVSDLTLKRKVNTAYDIFEKIKKIKVAKVNELAPATPVKTAG